MDDPEVATGVPAMARHIAQAARTALRRRRRIDRILDAALPDEPPRTPPLVLGVDGRSGSGKTLLAQAIAIELRAQLPHEDVPADLDRERSIAVLALEDLYLGWDGLEAGLTAAAGLLAALGRGEPGCAPQWDWHAMAVRGEVCIGSVDVSLPVVLVVEGCGAGSDTLAEFVDVLVWMDVPESTRRARARARDGEWTVSWESWAAQEDALLARRDAAAAADIVVGTVPPDARG